MALMTRSAMGWSISTTSSSSSFPSPSDAFTTKSGLPVCRYGLGGAARSTQPSNLPMEYCRALSLDPEEEEEEEEEESTTKKKISSSSSTTSSTFPNGAPFFFYYNPARYPAFLSGIQQLCSSSSSSSSSSSDESIINSINREDLFVASGGTERSIGAMEQRLEDALVFCGQEYLDLFILEYVCPYELSGNKNSGGVINSELQMAMELANEWKRQGRIRYVGASTHSHRVGAVLASVDGIDAMMLRYGMSHKDAAERLSFPVCVQNNKPVLAFTTTRWNSLQDGHMEWDDDSPTHSDCISFALTKRPPVEVVLHSARNEQELKESLLGLREDMSSEEIEKWRSYGDLDWNRSDGFDEYPEERE